MDVANTQCEAPALPEPFIKAYIEQARADAEVTGKWLRNNLGDSISECETTREFVLGIALSLRLCQWEVRRIRVHLDAGLPTGPQMMVTVFELCNSPQLSDYVDSIGTAMCRISFENFLWSFDDHDLAAFSIAVQTDADDERLLDLLAEYLVNRIGG